MNNRSLCIVVFFLLSIAAGLVSGSIFNIIPSYGLTSQDDQTMAITYEEIYRAAQTKFEFKIRPSIQKMRPFYAFWAYLPIMNGHWNARVVGKFIPEHNLIIIRKGSGTFGYDGGIIAHELGHAIGWVKFCETEFNCHKQLRKYSYSWWGSDEYANKIGQTIADAVIEAHRE